MDALPPLLAASVITAAELELGVMRATNDLTRAKRLSTLSWLRTTYPLLPLDERAASSYAGIAAAELAAGRKIRTHDTWIAATAHAIGVPVVTQDADFSAFTSVEVIRV